jgi:hypothetical protein
MINWTAFERILVDKVISGRCISAQLKEYEISDAFY